MKIDVNTFIVIVGFAITLWNTNRTKTKDIVDEVSERTKMYTKIDQNCTKSEEILRSVDRMTDKFDEVAKRQVSHDEQIRTAFKILENHEERIKELEHG